MTRNNVFSSVDCWWLGKEPIVSCVGSEKSRFQASRCSKWCPFASCLHVTTFSIDQLNYRWRFVICLPNAYVLMRRCFKWLVTAAGITDRWLYNVQTFLHQSTNSVVNRTVWWTQIWSDKVQSFLLNELDCFTSIEERQNASFPSEPFKSK